MAGRIFLAIAALFCIGAAPPGAPLVLAAVSLKESLTAAADAWAARRHPRPVISFAASSAIARQAASGGAADLIITADREWSDWLLNRQLIVPGTRAILARNRLVIVAPINAPQSPPLTDRRALADALGSGPLALADPAGVPAGRYAVASLTALGLWRGAAPHVVLAENVRAALALVERGAARYGIVYATDAAASLKVRIVLQLPEASHPPIVYPVARLAASRNPEGEAFRRFLLSREGQAIFRRFGFVVG